MVIREYLESDRAWAEAFIQVKVGGPLQARRGELIDVLALPGFVAERANRPVGFVTYRLDDAECELAFLAALRRHEGVGTALLQALLREVADCYRLKRCVSISGAASSYRRFALERSPTHANA